MNVKIYKLQNDGSQKVIATCTLQGDEVVVEGEEPFVTNLKTDGIRDYSSTDDKKLFPKDGKKFLEELKNNFRSAYLAAGDIEE